MNRTYKIGMRTLVFMLVCISLVCYCHRHEPIHVYEHPEQKIEVQKEKIKEQTLKHDTAYIEVVKYRSILKQSKNIIIHDTLKCEMVYQLALKQDTLIKIDSVLINELNKQVRNYEKLDTLQTKEIKKLKRKNVLNKILYGAVIVLEAIIIIKK